LVNKSISIRKYIIDKTIFVKVIGIFILLIFQAQKNLLTAGLIRNIYFNVYRPRLLSFSNYRLYNPPARQQHRQSRLLYLSFCLQAAPTTARQLHPNHSTFSSAAQPFFSGCSSSSVPELAHFRSYGVQFLVAEVVLVIRNGIVTVVLEPSGLRV